MPTVQRFEDLRAWQQARELAREVYLLTKQDAFARDFALSDQVRRSSGSIMHNIAEGLDSGSDREFIRFLRYARRSATEVQSELYLALDQKYVDETTFSRLYTQAAECKRSLNGLISYLKKSLRTSPESNGA